MLCYVTAGGLYLLICLISTLFYRKKNSSFFCWGNGMNLTLGQRRHFIYFLFKGLKSGIPIHNISLNSVDQKWYKRPFIALKRVVSFEPLSDQ